MRIVTFVLTLASLSGLPIHGQTRSVLQAPSDPVEAGGPLTLTLLITNEGATQATIEAPRTLSMIEQRSRGPRNLTLRRAEGAPAWVTLPAGGFVRVAYVGEAPPNVEGFVVLSAADPRLGSIALVVRASPTGGGAVVRKEAAAGAGAADAHTLLPVPRREFGVSPHEPLYFSVGFNDYVNARFQLSFKYRPLGPNDDRIAGEGFWEDIYVAFTQTSLWDLESDSKPFYDSSYRPAFFHFRHDTGMRFLGASVGTAAGFEHESNGKGGLDSRSLNILFVRPTLRWGDERDWHWAFSPKLYCYIDKEENPDLQRFRGYGDYQLTFMHPESWKLSATMRIGTSGKGSVVLDASFPFSRINDIVPVGWVHGYLHLQYFSGYGETLRSYDERAPWQVRIGLMALR